MILNNIYYIWIGIGRFDHLLKAQAIGVPFPFFNRESITIAMNQERKCTRCGEIKSLSEFNKQRHGKFGVSADCKVCHIVIIKEYRRTKKGLVSKIYGDQRNSSKKRNHPMPDYSKEELIDWMFSHNIFHVLYDEWVSSGFKRMLIPSCDRKDDYKPYSIGNLQITTWSKNEQRGHDDVRNGINNKRSRSVVGVHKITSEVVEFYSMAEAQRKTGISNGNISMCCNNRLKSSGGYKWEFSKPTL